jgi:hypothetical protein
VLACSDGLWHYFTPSELGAIVHALPPREASEMLVSKARQRARGGGDNLSLALVRVERSTDVAPRASAAPAAGGRRGGGTGTARRRLGRCARVARAPPRGALGSCCAARTRVRAARPRSAARRFALGTARRGAAPAAPRAARRGFAGALRRARRAAAPRRSARAIALARARRAGGAGLVEHDPAARSAASVARSRARRRRRR